MSQKTIITTGTFPFGLVLIGDWWYKIRNNNYTRYRHRSGIRHE